MQAGDPIAASLVGSADRGRLIVRVIGAMMVSTSLLVVLSYNITVGQDRLVAQLVRLAMTTAFAFFLARGSKIARAFVVVLGGIASLGAMVLGLLMSSIVLGLFGLLYATIAGLLVFQRDVRVFFDTAADRRRSPESF